MPARSRPTGPWSCTWRPDARQGSGTHTRPCQSPDHQPFAGGPGRVQRFRVPVRPHSAGKNRRRKPSASVPECGLRPHAGREPRGLFRSAQGHLSGAHSAGIRQRRVRAQFARTALPYPQSGHWSPNNGLTSVAHHHYYPDIIHKLAPIVPGIHLPYPAHGAAIHSALPAHIMTISGAHLRRHRPIRTESSHPPIYGDSTDRGFCLLYRQGNIPLRPSNLGITQ